MPLDVLCIGHAAYDILFYLERFPSENSKTEISLSLESGGGPAANAAYLLSKWGVSCAFAGVVGDDYYGQQILAEFQSVGTDTSLLEVSSGFSTPLSLILINRQTGSRTVVNRKALNSPLRLPRTALAEVSPKILLFDGHELEAARAFAREVALRRQIELVRERGDLAELALRATLEQRNPLQQLDLGVLAQHRRVQSLAWPNPVQHGPAR